MKCKKCGATLSDNANFCRVCGSQISNDIDELNHTSIQDNNELIVSKENLSEKSVSSTEIKKILEEMSNDEKKSSEPTVTIPINLIKKYCKSNEKKDEDKNDKVDLSINEKSLDDVNCPVYDETKSISDEIEKKETVDNLETKSSIENNDNKSIIKEKKDVIVKEELKIENNAEENIQNVNSESSYEKIEEDDININKMEDKKIELDDETLNDDNISTSKNYGRTFFVFFIIMICLSAIGYLVYVLYGSRNELEKIGKENVLLQEEVNNLKNNNLDSNQMVNGVIFNGYKFSSIKDNYVISNDSLILTINNTSYTIKINDKINYDDLKDKKDAYKHQLISEGYKVLSYGNKHIENNDYYVFSVSDKDNKKYLIAYSKLSEKTVIAFIIHSNDNNTSYDLLSTTNVILSSITKSTNDVSNDLNIFIEKK